MVHLDPFFMDEHPVTNKEFGKFVRAVYYETEAEHFGWSYVLSSFIPKPEMLEESDVDPEAVCSFFHGNRFYPFAFIYSTVVFILDISLQHFVSIYFMCTFLFRFIGLFFPFLDTLGSSRRSLLA